jgi:hypothetical protein
MSLESLSDQTVLTYYDSIRHEVDSDRRHGTGFATGASARARAAQLARELSLRGVAFTPIDWPDEALQPG